MPHSENSDFTSLPRRASDLKYKYCWVCSEEEVQTSNSFQNGVCKDASRSTSSRSRFIHPCKCSLVAHEKVCIFSNLFANMVQCLLSWIRQCSRDRPGAAIVCPQCKAPYELEQPRSLMLTVLEYVNRTIRSAIPLSASVIGIAGVWIAATAHGSWSVRMFLGERVAQRLLTSPWPLHVSYYDC